MHLDLTADGTAALIKELHDNVENDKYPFPPRIRTLRAILAKLDSLLPASVSPSHGPERWRR
jgi:hypothetical protein